VESNRTPFSWRATLCYILGDQFRQHSAQMVMKTGAVLGADPGIAGAPMLVDVLEDRQAETEHPFGPFCRGRRIVRLNRGKQVVNGTDQQFVLVAIVGVEGRPSNIGAVEDLLHRNRIVWLSAPFMKVYHWLRSREPGHKSTK
jgi:hypothetical protein